MAVLLLCLQGHCRCPRRPFPHRHRHPFKTFHRGAPRLSVSTRSDHPCAATTPTRTSDASSPSPTARWRWRTPTWSRTTQAAPSLQQVPTTASLPPLSSPFSLHRSVFLPASLLLCCICFARACVRARACVSAQGQGWSRRKKEIVQVIVL